MRDRYSRGWYDDFFAEQQGDQTEGEAFESIAEDIDRIWRSKWWSKKISDNESQLKLITVLRQRYSHPDYLDLVGNPSPDDYQDDGKLKTSRKAELLLIGTFNWQGLTIAKHPSVFGYVRERWSTTMSPRWGIDDKGWYVCHEAMPEKLSYDGFFTPFEGRPVQKLADHLANQDKPLPELHGTVAIDGNIYNCQLNNLRVISLRGRPMRCKGCDKRVTKEGSRQIRLDDTRLRYCLECIERMANWHELKGAWW